MEEEEDAVVEEEEIDVEEEEDEEEEGADAEMEEEEEEEEEGGRSPLASSMVTMRVFIAHNECVCVSVCVILDVLDFCLCVLCGFVDCLCV